MNLFSFSLLALNQILRKSHCVLKSRLWAAYPSEEGPTSNLSIQLTLAMSLYGVGSLLQPGNHPAGGYE